MKAILVVDIPDDCKECKLKYEYFDNGYGFIDYCVYSQKNSFSDNLKDHCPLKPLPNKYELTTEKGNRYAVGWNDCIDDILGETE